MANERKVTKAVVKAAAKAVVKTVEKAVAPKTVPKTIHPKKVPRTVLSTVPKIAKTAPKAAAPKESEPRNTPKSARFPVILLKGEWAIFAQLAFNQDLSILELIKFNLAKFGAPNVLKTFDYKKLDRIKPEFKASPESTHFVDFKLSSEEGGRLGDLAKKLKVSKGDVLRYIINEVVENEGKGIEIETDSPERIPKKRFDVNLPGDIYESISAYADTQQTSVSKLLRLHFPAFTDADYEKYKISVPRGRRRDMEKCANPDKNHKGPWTASSLASTSVIKNRSDLRYDLVHPMTGGAILCPAKGWRFTQEEFNRLISEGRVIWPDRANGRILVKTFRSESGGELTHKSITIYIDMYEQVKKRALKLKVLESDIIRAFLVYVSSTVSSRKKRA